MELTRQQDLTSKIELLVKEHIAASRKAVACAIERAFASYSEPAAIGRVTGGRRNRAATGASSHRREKATRRTETELHALCERLYQAVEALPGETMTAIAQHVGASPRDLLRPMARLKEFGRIRSAGERRQCRYFPMGNEPTAPK
jgi:hypothetical protein